MFGIMADIFLIAFAICVFQPWSFVFLAFVICVFVSPYLAVFRFAFSNKIIIPNLYRNFLIKMNVLQRSQFSVAVFSYILYISLLKFLHCIIAVWYGNKFKSVRIATDTSTLWTITVSFRNSPCHGKKKCLRYQFYNMLQYFQK